MRNERKPRSRLFWAAILGVVVIVSAMIVTLCLLQLESTTPEAVETSVPGLGESPVPSGAGDPDIPVIGHRTGDLAPPFSLPALDGGLVSLSDYRGRIVILDFWASWCVPCRLSMPSLEAMARDLGNEVVLLGVSLDRSESAAQSYVTSHDYTDLIALYGSLSAARRVAADFGVVGIPRTFVIDREGIVRFAGHPGRLGRDLIESLL